MMIHYIEPGRITRASRTACGRAAMALSPSVDLVDHVDALLAYGSGACRTCRRTVEVRSIGAGLTISEAHEVLSVALRAEADRREARARELYRAWVPRDPDREQAKADRLREIRRQITDLTDEVLDASF